MESLHGEQQKEQHHASRGSMRTTSTRRRWRLRLPSSLWELLGANTDKWRSAAMPLASPLERRGGGVTQQLKACRAMRNPEPTTGLWGNTFPSKACCAEIKVKEFLPEEKAVPLTQHVGLCRKIGK